MQMKILTVIGARPQFIKAATVSRELKNAGMHEVIVHTGQHFDHTMSKVFFEEMEIPHPNYNLEISGLNHGAMTGRMMEKIEEVLLSEKPDWVLVFGDTNSTLAGALAAAKLHISVAHVEAGLRSFEMRMPEEINRILTDRVSKLLFCPTPAAVKNLENEGFSNFDSEVVLCGDVMYDAVLYYKEKVKSLSTILKKENLSGKPFVLATLHRAENTDDPNRLRQICEALKEIQKEVQVVLPLHPRTKATLKSQNINLQVKIIDPVGYFDMLALLENCRLVLTDSGGLQKEAYFFSKYCITLRDQTEWVELVEAKVNFLVGADKEKIISHFHLLLDKEFPDQEILYGKGNASSLIVKKLKGFKI
jgi:UDP-GlcNAc3NAcA epimerase